MKLKHLLIIAIVLSLLISSVVSIPRLRRKRSRVRGNGDLPDLKDEDKGFPADVQKDSTEAVEKARKQTAAARKLFYSPNSDAVEILSKAAGYLLNKVNFMKTEV